MSESRIESVEVGVLSRLEGAENEDSEAMMRIRDCGAAIVKATGKLACLLYPSSAHCRTFDNQSPESYR